MKTSNLDVVYFVREGENNEELRYSLRSVAKNLAHRNVWVFGNCPTWAKPDYCVEIKQDGLTKWDIVHDMILAACFAVGVSDNFILMNDDFYVMQKCDQIKPVHRGELSEHILSVEDKHGGEWTNYSKLLRRARKELKGASKSTLSYELHIPAVFNKNKLLKLVERFPNSHCLRSMYSNYHGIGGDKIEDVKVSDNGKEFKKDTTFLSSIDETFMPETKLFEYIAEKFPEKCEYEK